MTMITPSYLGETIEYSSLHACRSTLEDPTSSIVEPFALRERASSWREETPRRSRSPNRSAMRTWPHLHVYFARP